MVNRNKELSREEIFILSSSLFQILDGVPEDRREMLVRFHQREAERTKADIQARIKRQKRGNVQTDGQIALVQSFFDKHAIRNQIYTIPDIKKELDWTNVSHQKMGYIMSVIVGIDKLVNEDGRTGYRLKKDYNPLKDTWRAREIENKLDS